MSTSAASTTEVFGERTASGQFVRAFTRNRLAIVGAVLVAVFLITALAAPWIAPCDPTKMDLDRRMQPPCWAPGGSSEHLLGCDHMGRDLLSRIIYGSRISLLIGFAVVLLTAAVGLIAGLLAGYYGGVLDAVLSRLVDILLAFPFLIFALAVTGAMGPGLVNMMLALVFKGWVDFYRVVRADVLVAKASDYVLAARSLGASSMRLMVGEILPNVVPSMIVLGTFNMAVIIIAESSLSFLGLGVQPPTPAWGSMVNDGRPYMLHAWWISTLPGLAILLLVLGINLLGEGLRDALDPRLKD